MARKYSTLAFATLLASAPLIGAASAAEPAGLPERPTTTAASPTENVPSETTRVYRTTDGVQRTTPAGELSVPVTPVPMNLPDEATAGEVKGEYGIGVAGLILGTVLIAALVIGIFYVVSRRSWSTSH